MKNKRSGYSPNGCVNKPYKSPYSPKERYIANKCTGLGRLTTFVARWATAQTVKIRDGINLNLGYISDLDYQIMSFHTNY